MTKVQAIEKEVESLSSKELAAFRRWFEELDAEAWDRQLEDDVHAGRLDALAKEALEAYEAGEKVDGTWPLGWVEAQGKQIWSAI